MWRHRILHRSRDLAAIAADDACPDCRAAGRDWSVIAAALHATVTPPRTRDFRLTAADARRLAPAPARPAQRRSPAPRYAGALAAGLLLLVIAGVRPAAAPVPADPGGGPVLMVAPAGDAARSVAGEDAGATVMTLAVPSALDVASPSPSPLR